MKNNLLSALFIGFLFFLFTGNAFAQEPVANGNAVAQMATVPEANLTEPAYDWEKESKLYKALGWSFFGVGLAVAIASPIAAVAVGWSDLKNMDFKFYNNAKNTLIGIGVVGGAMFLTGVGLVIADFIKFYPYRNGGIGIFSFEWRPEIYASPEFSGFGLSARF